MKGAAAPFWVQLHLRRPVVELPHPMHAHTHANPRNCNAETQKLNCGCAANSTNGMPTGGHG